MHFHSATERWYLPGMTGESIKDAIRRQVFEREQHRWSMSRKPNWLGRLLRFLSELKKPPEAFFIAEFQATDTASLQCTGDILQAWRLDENGLRSIAPAEIDTGEVVGRSWPRPLIRFFISENNDCVVLNDMDGPQQGVLIHLIPEQTPQGVKLKAKRTEVTTGGHERENRRVRK
jgi:hypothetical protein